MGGPGARSAVSLALLLAHGLGPAGVTAAPLALVRAGSDGSRFLEETKEVHDAPLGAPRRALITRMNTTMTTSGRRSGLRRSVAAAAVPRRLNRTVTMDECVKSGFELRKRHTDYGVWNALLDAGATVFIYFGIADVAPLEAMMIKTEVVSSVQTMNKFVEHARDCAKEEVEYLTLLQKGAPPRDDEEEYPGALACAQKKMGVARGPLPARAIAEKVTERLPTMEGLAEVLE